MRKQVMAIAARVSAAKRLLDAAEVHIRDAAVEDDPQHSAALLTLGGELADFAELILRNVNDGPEPLQEPEVAEQAQQPQQPKQPWIELQWRDGFADTIRNAWHGKYKAVATLEHTGKWHLQIFAGDLMASFSQHDQFDTASCFANDWVNYHAAYFAKYGEVTPQQPTTPLQWLENFSDGTYHALRDKYRATVQQAQAGEWTWRVNFDGKFRQYGAEDSLTKAMQRAEDCIAARIIRNETVDAEMAVMP